MTDLSEREQLVLQHIIAQYIQTASPVGSRTISKQSELSLSPASIRNIMADLEEKGYIDHPHTSAGRVPTDLGYRFYVDQVMMREGLATQERKFIEHYFETVLPPDFETIVRECSRLLGEISQQLAVVSTPHIGSGVLRHLDLIELSTTRIMVVLSIESGIVKTITFEVDTEISRQTLDRLARLLNERLSGLTLRQIRESFSERVKDAAAEGTDRLIELFIQSSDRLFSERLEESRIYIDGMRGMMRQPEFGQPERLRDVIELVENHNVIIHVLEAIDEDASIAIRIGSETGEERMKEYSLIASPYRIGTMTGMLSVLGPRRMNYARMIAILETLSSLITKQSPR